MRATGQENVGFLDLNWSKLYSDSTAAVRAQQKAFEYVTGQTFGPREQGSNSGPQGASQSGAPNRVKSGLTEALSSTARAGLGAAGPVGGVAASALGTGISAGFGAGLMGLIGGLAALAVGKAVSAVREQIGAAEQESIRYADLKRTLGDVGVSFKTLRESVHASAMALSVNYDESQRLASAFAKMSNGLTSAGAIGSEVAIGGGIGRAYGLDPSAGVAFNAQMRRFGATSDEQGSRRMALLVGETIARASGFAQAGEILQAIASYTEQQTRLGLSTANVPAYAGYMSALVGSGIPGMDAKGAASLLGIVNSSVQRGGDEAVQMFYGHLGRSMGITDPIMMAYLREQGAFTTGAEAFNNQVFKDFAGRHGISMPDMSGEQGPFIQRVLDALRGQFAGDPFGMLNAMQRAFPGISLSQGMALDGMSPDMIGGILDSLSRLDIDMNSVSGSSIGLLGKVHAGDRNALMEVAQNLAGRTEAMPSRLRSSLLCKPLQMAVTTTS